MTLESLPVIEPMIAQTNGHHVPFMLRLQYKPKPTSRKWQDSYAMHEAGLPQMEKDRRNLATQEGWHETRIARVPVVPA